MEKVILPKEVADAIERLRKEDYGDTQIVYEVEACKAEDVIGDYFFDVATPDTLMRALVLGYEIEPN